MAIPTGLVVKALETLNRLCAINSNRIRMNLVVETSESILNSSSRKGLLDAGLDSRSCTSSALGGECKDEQLNMPWIDSQTSNRLCAINSNRI